MFFVSVYISVNNSPEYCLISTINHTGRGCCQRYWPPLVTLYFTPVQLETKKMAHF